MEAKLVVPAAQYVRMSREDQQYSMANQKDAIQIYARSRGYVVTATCPAIGTACRNLGAGPGRYPIWLPTIFWFSAGSLGMASGIPRASFLCPVQERQLPTDTILVIRCPHCIAGTDFRPMIAHKDGRFVCRDCAHTVRPGLPEYRCTCRGCLSPIRRVLRA